MSAAATKACVRRLSMRVLDRCCALVDLLRRNVEMLVREACDVLALEEDYNRLQGAYVWLLARVGGGVCRLLAGDAPALDAASDVLGAWLRAEDVSRADMRRMQLLSRTTRGIPVSLLVKRAEQTAMDVTEAMPETKPHKRCRKKAAALHKQVRVLSPHLQQASRTLQILLYLSRALPLLRQFHNKLEDFSVLGKDEEEVPAESTDGEDRKESALYCGGPLWTRLTSEVCHHHCQPQKLAKVLEALPRHLDLNLNLDPYLDPNLNPGLEMELDLLEGHGNTKRKASPIRNPLIGMLEDEDDLQTIKIPHLDPSIFKPLPD